MMPPNIYLTVKQDGEGGFVPCLVFHHPSIEGPIKKGEFEFELVASYENAEDANYVVETVLALIKLIDISRPSKHGDEFDA